MDWLLLTNDDGVDSPALRPFARALAARWRVRVVAPAGERSWVGKAITRHGLVRVATLDDDPELDGWSHDGYPADGVQLGIHALAPTPPSLVVAGVNLGYNHGAAFTLSSGTVGATLEAWTAGIPAVAFSTSGRGRFDDWRRAAAEDGAQGTWSRLAGLCAELTAQVLASGVLDHADVVSVNLPFDADASTPRRVTELARVGYGPLFVPTDGGFRFGFDGGLRGPATADGTDVRAAADGEISITPLRLPQAVDLPPETRRALEGAGPS